MAGDGRRWKPLDLLREASGFLGSRGLDSPRLEAELLLAAALGVRRLDLYLQFDRILTAAEVEAFRGFVRQRLAGRPSQYITGEAGFRLLDLHVDESVLVPRPETELLVEEALAFLGDAPPGPVLDLGCGSGAIAIAIAREHEGVQVVASDLSHEALVLARTGEQPSASTAAGRRLRIASRADPALRDLRRSYIERQTILHGECFYHDDCQPEETEDLIQETTDFIRQARSLSEA